MPDLVQEPLEGATWKALPAAGRKAVQAYGLKGLPRDLRWGYAEVPLGWLAQEAWEERARRRMDPVAPHPSIDAFVAAHEICTPTYSWMKRKPNSIWAIVLDGPPDGPYMAGSVIEDGWHRFGWYLCRYDPDTLIPVIWGIHR